MAHRSSCIAGLALLVLLAPPASLASEELSGKVIGITDGDTL